MSRAMIGHILQREHYVEGIRGLAYDYVFARNGVFLETESNLINARVRLVDTEIRGLAPLTEKVELLHGLVPTYFLAMALRTMLQDIHREVYLAVTLDGDFYRLQRPPQSGSGAKVTYEPLPNTVVDFHSHGRMGAHFSATDDRYDQGFRVSVVIGRLDQREAEFSMRLGIYGYHVPVSFLQVFSGPLPQGLLAAL